MNPNTRRVPRPGPLPRVFYGWYIVAAGIGIHAWVATAWIYGMQVFFTPLTEHFGWSRAAIATAFSLNRIEGGVLTPIEGWLVDRYGPRKMILVGAVFMGAGFIVLSRVTTIWSFYAGMLIVAAGTSATMGVPRTWAITQWFRRIRGRAMGIGNLGGVFGGPLLLMIAWLVGNFGWRAAFFILGVGSLAVCLPLAFVFRARPEQYGYLPDGDSPATDGPNPASTATVQGVPRGARTRAHVLAEVAVEESYTIRQALKTRAFWILVGIFAIQHFGTGGINVHLVAYLVSDDVGFAPLQAASVLGFFTVLSIFGRLGGGWAADWFGARVTMAVLFAFMALGFLVLVNMNAYWMVPVYALLYGTAFGGLMTGRSVIIGNFFGRNSFGTIWGVMNSASMPVAIVAPVFMGWVFDVTGSYRPALWAIVTLCTAAVPLTLLARPPRRERPDLASSAVKAGST